MIIAGLITARGGSKGIPGKNLALLSGRPLIEWTIDAALAARSLSSVIVSTDDAEIAGVSRAAGAMVPFLRPSALAGDATPHVLAVDHAIAWMRTQGPAPDYVMLLQPTSPLRTTADIDAAAAIAEAQRPPAVVSVSLVTTHPMHMLTIGDSGALHRYVPSDIEYLRRQDLPPVFAENGAIYLNSLQSIARDRSFVPTGALPYVMPPDRSLEVDAPHDLVLVEAIMTVQATGRER